MPNDNLKPATVAKPESEATFAAPTGYATWLKWIESTEKSADRCGDRDVVPATLAKQLAARLDEAHKMQKILIKALSHNP